MSTLNTFATWFLLFIIYAVVGWCVEVLHVLYKNKKLSNRGFLIGPICPIYGCGAIMLTLLLGRTENVFIIFLVSVIASAVLEYLTSFLMEKLFRVRWWDYSNVPFNIRGRICLANLLYFGIFGILIIRFANPFLFSLIGGLSPTVRIILAAIAFAIFICDIAVSLWLIIECRVTVGTVNRDATDEITANIQETLMDKGKLNRRLAKAFPNMEAKKKVPRQRKTSSRSKSTKRLEKPSK